MKHNALLVNYLSILPLTLSGVYVPFFPIRTESLLCNIQINPSIVSATIHKEDTHKACGLHDTPTIILKKYVPEMVPVLSNLYNKYVAALLEFL